MTRDLQTIVAAANDPDQTVTCSFFDLSNGGESLAVVKLGETIGVSPTNYKAGTELLVVVTRTSAIAPTYETVRERVIMGEGNLVVPLNIAVSNAGENVLNEVDDPLADDVNPDGADPDNPFAPDG